MQPTELRPDIHWVGAVDWERRVFDELVPTSEGTTYNAYLVRGAEKTALIDTVDPAFTSVLLRNLESLEVRQLDYVICNHAEQDHSGSLPAVLARYPRARVVATPTCKLLLRDLLHVPDEQIDEAEDGAKLSLGGRTLRFIHFPWVHWPDTMLTLVEEDRVLLSGDLFGSHLAGSVTRPTDDPRALAASKLYYATIMMPFRQIIERGLAKLHDTPLELVGPSHGPMLSEPAVMLETYRSWVADPPLNLVVIPYISMHDSTRQLVLHLARGLSARGLEVELLHLGDLDVAKLAPALVDASTVVLGSPTVLGGAHPKAAYAAFLLNALRPKIRYASLIGSYGWGGGLLEQIVGLIPDLSVELLDPVVVKGLPRAEDLAAVDRLADEIARRHGLLEAVPAGAPAAAAEAGGAPEVKGSSRKYKCTRCGWVYDPSRGDPTRGVKPGTPFEEIPDEKWYCPFCGLGKKRFRPL